MTSQQPDTKKVLPYNPIKAVMASTEHARRTIAGVLESYNSNYDALAEAVQNSMDALEDAKLQKLPGPYLLEITIDLQSNSLSVFDTGVGMTEEQVCEAFAPSASFKDSPEFVGKRGDKHPYRGYKGVGLTFLAYGTDDVLIQSRQNSNIIKGRMKYGRAWAEGTRTDVPMLVKDTEVTALEKHRRGTFIRIQFSPTTRPASLPHLGSTLEQWEAIIRTRTAAGQVLMGQDPVASVAVKLNLVTSSGPTQDNTIEPTFYYPHLASRNPSFRFLDVWEYHKENPGIVDHSADVTRQDGVYIHWTTNEIQKHLSQKDSLEYESELAHFTPQLYAFRPYHAPLWTEVSRSITGRERTPHFGPGLVIAVNRQRLADTFQIMASRSELLARNIFVVVHFDRAKPDQGRKTLQTKVMELAHAAADSAVQYLLKQGGLLKPAGEKTTAAQRAVEKNHEDWVDNVKGHAKLNPLKIDPVSYISTPITEQDVVGLFHQFSALGLFPGLRILATSGAHTYDCYARFDCSGDMDPLRYYSVAHHPLGLSSDILGPDDTEFTTRGLTLEFKNNLDGLIEEIDDKSKKKTFHHIEICVCWGVIADRHKYYSIEPVTEQNLHERKYPGVTHILRKDGESHVMQVILLEDIVKKIEAGQVLLPKTEGRPRF